MERFGHCLLNGKQSGYEEDSKVKQYWKNDYYRMTGEKYSIAPKCLIRTLFSHQIRYMKLWRKANEKMSPVLKLGLLQFAKKYGLEISPTAKLGQGIYLGHPYNITVATGVQIGNNVNLHKGCTIGRENRGKRKGTPVIGDRVYIGINSTIVGNIYVGNDVMIAPNTFINFDVPDHSIVIGNPATIYHKDNATEGYIAFCVE